MSTPPPARALLVDDERLARRRLRRLLEAHADRVIVVDEAPSVARAAAILAEQAIDVVFLDVQMPGRDGFALFDVCTVRCHIVFVTAFERHAVRAFEVNALDYLVKPVEPARLSVCLDRIGTQRHATEPVSDTDRIHVEVDGGHAFVALRDVWAIRAAGDYTELILANGRAPWTRTSLSAWVERLGAQDYLRIHRSAIVRLSAITKLERGSERDFIACVGPHAFPVSRRVLAELRRRLLARSTM